MPFLPNHRVIVKGGGETRGNEIFDGPVSRTHEILRPLQLDAKIFRIHQKTPRQSARLQGNRLGGKIATHQRRRLHAKRSLSSQTVKRVTRQPDVVGLAVIHAHVHAPSKKRRYTRSGGVHVGNVDFTQYSGS
jgi:hypothetical protein